MGIGGNNQLHKAEEQGAIRQKASGEAFESVSCAWKARQRIRRRPERWIFCANAAFALPLIVPELLSEDCFARV